MLAVDDDVTPYFLFTRV